MKSVTTKESGNTVYIDCCDSKKPAICFDYCRPLKLNKADKKILEDIRVDHTFFGEVKFTKKTEALIKNLGIALGKEMLSYIRNIKQNEKL